MMDLSLVDHLVVAAPDVDQAAEELEERLGAVLLPGGRHPAWGTRNRIVPLGPSVYLEVIGPDSTQTSAPPATIFSLDRVERASLVTWALASPDLPELAARARKKGLPIGPPLPGRRVREDGVELSWTLTDPAAIDPDSLLPFLIRWSSAHPAEGWSGAVELVHLEARHPRPAEVTDHLATLRFHMPIEHGARPELIATLRGPKGEVSLRR